MDINGLVIKEIKEIPRVVGLIKDRIKNIDKVVSSIISEGVNELVYTGCGSSYYAAIRSSYPLSTSPFIKAHTLPTSEVLWVIPNKTSNRISKEAVLIFSRSGETAEIKALLNVTRKYRNILVIGFTCNPGSFLANNSDHVVVVEECMEESVYMTKSFIALSVLGTIFSMKLLENLGNNKLANDLEYEVEALIRASEILVDDLDNPRRIANVLTHKSPIAVLGTEDLYPIALEASLKLIEISYTPSIALHALEFRHGYTGLLENPNFSAILLSNSERISHEYVVRLHNELKLAGASSVFISNTKSADYVIDVDGKSHLTTLAYIIPLYYITVFRAMNLGYNPDKPKRITKIVTSI